MYKISYTGDGETLEYIFAFPFFQIADIHVCIDDVALTSDAFSVMANEQMTGGTVVFLTPPSAGAQIDIFRQVTLSRVVDYQPTAQIDPEALNSDINFLLAAFQELHSVNLDLAEWKNTHDNMKTFLEYTVSLVEDKLSGGGVLGLFNNLVSVLDNALPDLINDYGLITDVAPNENCDDYGIL